MIRGYVDILSLAHVSGWAYDSERPRVPLQILVEMGGKSVAEALADGEREDLRLAGHGSCAFDIHIDPARLPRVIDSIEVCTREGDTLLTTGLWLGDESIASDDAMFSGDIHHYLRVGADAARIIEFNVVSLLDVASVLDLPCGHGRVLRHLIRLFPNAKFTACDIDRSGVDFCRSKLSATGVYSNEEFDIEFDRDFDVMWVGSLITHLPETATRKFFEFAFRNLSKKGVLVVTSHGVCALDRLSPEDYGLTPSAIQTIQDQFAASGYGYADFETARDYGVSVISGDWFDEYFAGRTDVVLHRFLPRRWDDHQDVLVIRRATLPNGT